MVLDLSLHHLQGGVSPGDEDSVRPSDQAGVRAGGQRGLRVREHPAVPAESNVSPLQRGP